ncbi:hypothetical protein SETIT_8G246800v2 [Setaria italica]|uniref:GH18 domain-containing protein n=1 Tax=Setaria italica TaxID=4555 RepID=A0A368SBK2_SETIT|nr:hypothetical protein SETIT_8G246800v2 [Setaria italica]
MTLQLRSPLLAQTTLSSCLMVVWGRNRAERAPSGRPATRAFTYATVILYFLRVAGHGKYLTDLSGHDVSTVGADVKHCQSAKNVTVLLSVVAGSYNSPAAARDLGLFERLHVRFYDEARCGYDHHETRPFWGAWHMWVSRFPVARLLVGLPATDGMRGWIDPATLRERDSVLPSVQGDPTYGGLMLWDRYYNKLTGYSRAIDP